MSDKKQFGNDKSKGAPSKGDGGKGGFKDGGGKGAPSKGDGGKGWPKK
ncbi:MAG: hypothetical protein AB8I08_01385 [Sandaracinaceae bacterium]